MAPNYWSFFSGEFLTSRISSLPLWPQVSEHPWICHSVLGYNLDAREFKPKNTQPMRKRTGGRGPAGALHVPVTSCPCVRGFSLPHCDVNFKYLFPVWWHCFEKLWTFTKRGLTDRSHYHEWAFKDSGQRLAPACYAVSWSFVLCPDSTTHYIYPKVNCLFSPWWETEIFWNHGPK